MPMQSVTLAPGVNTQKTLAANEAGVSVSNLIRYKENLIQKYGGWQRYYATFVSTTPVRDLHAFMGLRTVKYVGLGAVGDPVRGQALQIISCGILTDITPQTRPNVSNNAVGALASVNSGSCAVTVFDTGCNLTIYDSVQFLTPISIGNLIIQGCYPVAVGGANSFQIYSSEEANVNLSSGLLPTFSISSGSAICTVTFPNFQWQQVNGLYYPFLAPTTWANITVQGPYFVVGGVNLATGQANIGLTAQSCTTQSSTVMNGGNASYNYFVTAGPPATGGPYGFGPYGRGAYGKGTIQNVTPGTPITATDWILDNAGNTLLAVPRGGALFVWNPETGLSEAQVVPTAPMFSLGMFVAQPQQITVFWGSVQSTGAQDPLVVRWSDLGDYTNYNVLPTTYAGSFHMPTGSTLMCGIQSPIYGAVVWTDVDVWLMQYVGQPLVFSFNRMGTGCGALGPHCADINQGNVFWVSKNNFFMLGAGGVQVIPCTVWDYFFQQLDLNNVSKVRCASNSVFNEIVWFFPVIGGNGENSNYVKLHLEGSEFQWDYGALVRTAWIDVTAAGNPIGASYNSQGQAFVYQHDVAFDNDGAPINAFFETGYFAIADGEELLFVDWCLPDMKWGFSEFGAGPITNPATVIFTFYAVDYEGDTERVVGPFTITQPTEYISPRLRGRLFRMRIESQDQGTFWRLGRVRFRFAPDGRR